MLFPPGIYFSIFNVFQNTLLEKRLLPTFYIAFCVKFAQLIFHLFSDDNALPWIHTDEKSSSFAYQQFGTTEVHRYY